MTQNEKKQEQKAKAKSRALKILNIGCYIGTLLLALILVLAGLQSCNNKKVTSVSAEAPTIQVENLARTEWQFNDVLTGFDEYDQYEWQVLFKTQAGTQYQYIYIDDYSMTYRYNRDSEPYYAYTDQYGWDGISGQNITFFGEYTYLNYDNADLIAFLELNASLVTPLNEFTFNKTYNYNAPLGLNVGIVGLPFTNDLAWVTISDIVAPSTKTETTAILHVVPFYSNGTQYNAIVSHYVIARTNNILYQENREGNVSEVKAGIPVFDYMSYQYIENGSAIRSDIVNTRDTTSKTYEDAERNVYQLSTTWFNDAYRYLNFGGYAVTGDIATRLRGFNNNNEVFIPTNESDIGNAFNLLTGVFGAIAPILSIMILPQISIGVLIFIPLVVGIIIFIIDKIKK